MCPRHSSKLTKVEAQLGSSVVSAEKIPIGIWGGTSCLIGQEGGVTSRQCRMSPPVSTRWACASVAASRCARVERSAEESEHRRQWQSSMETKTRAQAQKYMAQQRGTFSARRMLICSDTTATSQEHQGRASHLNRVSDLLLPSLPGFFF